jgi:hypothetical protein
MKSKCLLLALALSVVPIHAQSTNIDYTRRIDIGSYGGAEFGNTFLGVTTAIAIPIRYRLELSLTDSLSPFETHIALGHGYANIVNVGGTVWLSEGFGINSSFEYSAYSVTNVKKGGYFAFGGVTFRRYVLGVPSRISLDYVRQVNNGISSAGVESAHLQGVNIG